MLQKSQEAQNVLLWMKYKQDKNSGEQQQETVGWDGRQRCSAVRKSFYSSKNLSLASMFTVCLPAVKAAVLGSARAGSQTF